MKVLYFAWLRQRIGQREETIELPDGVSDVSGVVDLLRGRSDAHARALANMDAVRVAVNKEFAEMSTAVKSGDELALFPPVTGG